MKIQLTLLFFLVLFSSCSKEKRIIKYEKENIEANHNELYSLIEYIKTKELSSIYIAKDGDLLIHEKGKVLPTIIKYDSVELGLRDCIERLKKANYVGITRGDGYVKFIPDQSLFDKECYHIRIFEKDKPDVESKKVVDNIYIYFESCLAI